MSGVVLYMARTVQTKIANDAFFTNMYVCIFNLTLCLLIPRQGELSAHVAQCTDISTKKILFSKLQSAFSSYNHQE